jgi:hypothetical protein
MDASSGRIVAGEPVRGGENLSFVVPFSTGAVLHLRRISPQG